MSYTDFLLVPALQLICQTGVSSTPTENLQPGYWHHTYFPAGYWQISNQYFPIYGLSDETGVFATLWRDMQLSQRDTEFIMTYLQAKATFLETGNLTQYTRSLERLLEK